MPGLAPGSRVTLCHVSDIHSDAFGDYSAQAVEIIARRKPDAVLFTGDLMDCRRDEDGVFFFRLLDRLPEIPMIASPGNHEKRIERAWGMRWHFATDCKARGMHYLDNAHVRLTLQEQEVDFYGYIQPFKVFTKHGKKKARLRQAVSPEEITRALGTCPTGATVLLAHDPVLLESYATWGAPLVLSGHIHGGVVKIPGVGGLLSPARKFFPPYDDGLYECGKTKMIVSRGLCAPMFPRINNAPDVAFVTLVGEEGIPPTKGAAYD
jgi:predicted MPP superfamily phosphohydrolase